MTEEILSKEPYFDDNLYMLRARELRVLKFVAGGLAMRYGAEGKNPLGGINIEDLFTAVEMLSDRESLQIAPFVAQWHNDIQKIELWSDGFTVDRELERAIKRALTVAAKSETDSFVLEDVSRRVVKKLDDYIKGNRSRWYDSAFEETKHSLTEALKELVWLRDDRKTEYLDPLVRAVASRGSSIATLNYDNAVELAAERLGIEVEIGLEGWASERVFEPPENGIELLKLHGSIDWMHAKSSAQSEDEANKSLFPTREVSRVDIKNVRSTPYMQPALIFGAGNKLTEKGPFLELFRTFERRLSRYNELLTVGYSFQDRHINHVIFRWMNQSASRRLFVIDKPGIEEKDHSLWQNHQEAANSDRVELVATGAVEGLKKHFAAIN